MLDLLLRILFRYDVFISYARSDGTEFATKLKEQLASMDISCFIDYDKIVPGDTLFSTLQQATRRSKALLLIGTPGALVSSFVETEFTNSLHAKRIIIPININETLTKPPAAVMKNGELLPVKKEFAETLTQVMQPGQLVWITERSDAIAEGRPADAAPSAHIYSEISKLFKHDRRNRRVRAAITASAMVLLLLSLVAVWKAAQAAQRQREVEAQTRQLTITNGQLQTRNDELKDREEKLKKTNDDLLGAQTSLKETNDSLIQKQNELRDKTAEAIREREAAETNARLAKEQEKIAQENAQKAEKRRRQALAGQLSIESNLLRNEQGRQLERSVLLALNAQRISDELNTPSANTLDALSSSLSILPERLKLIERDQSIISIIPSADKKFQVVLTEDHVAHIYDAMDYRELRSIGGEQQGYVATVSRNGARVVTMAANYTIKLWRAADGVEMSSFKMERSGHVVISYDGELVATVTDGDPVQIWKTADGTRLKSIDFKSYVVRQMDFSQADNLLALSGERGGDGMTRVVNPLTGKQVMEIHHENEIQQLSFSPKGMYLLVASRSFGPAKLPWGVEVWHVKDEFQILEKPEKVNTLAGEPITKLVFSPDEESLAVVLREGTVQLWDFITGESFTIGDQKYRATDVVFTPQGDALATLNADSTVRLWNLSNRREGVRMVHDGTPTAAAFIDGGERLITGGKDKSIRVWRPTTGLVTATLAQGRSQKPFDTPMRMWVVSADYNVMATQTLVEVRVWDGATGRTIWELPSGSLNGYTLELALSADGRFLATLGTFPSSNTPSNLQLWDVANKRLIASKDINGDVEHLAVDKEGRFVLAYLNRGVPFVLKWRPDNDSISWLAGSEEPSLEEFSKSIPPGSQFSNDKDPFAEYDRLVKEWKSKSPKQTIISRNAMYAAAITKDNRLVVYEAESGRERASINVEPDEVLDSFNSDGSLVVTRLPNLFARVLSTSDLREAFPRIALNKDETLWLKNPYGAVMWNPFSPRSSYLLIKTGENSLRVWNLRAGKEMWGINLDEQILAANFSLDEQALAIGSADHTSRVWDVLNGRELNRQTHDSEVIQTQFNADATRLLVREKKDFISFFLWKPTDLISLACTRLTRKELTPKERKQYLSEEPYYTLCTEAVR
jgi:WD40 repeat protein